MTRAGMTMEEVTIVPAPGRHWSRALVQHSKHQLIEKKIFLLKYLAWFRHHRQARRIVKMKDEKHTKSSPKL